MKARTQSYTQKASARSTRAVCYVFRALRKWTCVWVHRVSPRCDVTPPPSILNCSCRCSMAEQLTGHSWKTPSFHLSFVTGSPLGSSCCRTPEPWSGDTGGGSRSWCESTLVFVSVSCSSLSLSLSLSLLHSHTQSMSLSLCFSLDYFLLNEQQLQGNTRVEICVDYNESQNELLNNI